MAASRRLLNLPQITALDHGVDAVPAHAQPESVRPAFPDPPRASIRSADRQDPPGRVRIVGRGDHHARRHFPRRSRSRRDAHALSFAGKGSLATGGRRAQPGCKSTSANRVHGRRDRQDRDRRRRLAGVVGPRVAGPPQPRRTAASAYPRRQDHGRTATAPDRARRRTGCAPFISAPGITPGPRSKQAAASTRFSSIWTSRMRVRTSSRNPSS